MPRRTSYILPVEEQAGHVNERKRGCQSVPGHLLTWESHIPIHALGTCPGLTDVLFPHSEWLAMWMQKAGCKGAPRTQFLSKLSVHEWCNRLRQVTGRRSILVLGRQNQEGRALTTPAKEKREREHFLPKPLRFPQGKGSYALPYGNPHFHCSKGKCSQ